MLIAIDRIYTLEKTLQRPGGSQDAESSPLLTGDTNPEPVFRRALDSELEKICSFYQLKELEIYGELQELLKEENYIQETDGLDGYQIESMASSRQFIKGGRARHGSIFHSFGFGGRSRRSSTLSASMENLDEDADSDDEDAGETDALRRSSPSARRKSVDVGAYNSRENSMYGSRELPGRNRRASVAAADDLNEHALSALYDSGVTLKKRIIGLYVNLCELKSFIQLNKTGFGKALKKFDKILDRSLRSTYMEDSVKPAYPFKSSTMEVLDEKISKIEHSYAEVATKGDVSLAKRELRLHLREHVVWERNTVWRDMIGIERKAQAASLGIRQTLLGGDHDPAKVQLQGDEGEVPSSKEVVTPIGRYRCPTWLFSSTFFMLISIVIVFILLLGVPTMEKREQQNCLAMLVFVSLLWATEVRDTPFEVFVSLTL